MNKFLNRSLLSILAILGLTNLSSSAWASGFSLTEQSVKNLGNAANGGAALAEDASTIFYNPAGLTRLSGNSVEGAGYIIFSTIEFQNQGSTVVTGDPLLGGEGGNIGENSFVPNLYGFWSVSEAVKLGIGVSPPFGLATDYNSDWVGRYQAIESRLKTVNINPSVALKLTNTLSLGGGLNFQYADAELSNAIDFGLIGQLNGLGTQPQQLDGLVEIEGDDWSFGYNLGLLYEPTKNTRIGIAYRSDITHTLEGNADFTVPNDARVLTARGQFLDSDAEADLKLPDSLSLSIYQQLNDRWALMGDLTWTNWSRFRELRIQFDNPAQPDTVEPENWEDTLRFGLGVSYKVNEDWKLRAGVAYDQGPVKEEFTTARIPDGDRTWLALGFSYQPSSSLSLDFAYVHIFFEDRSINKSEPLTGTLQGEFTGHADVIGLQLNWKY